MFSYVLTFIEGILTFISPCILPMLPVYFIYLNGVSGEGPLPLGEQKPKTVTNALGFVLGFTLVFVLMGATVTAFGHFLVSHKDLLRKVSGIVMILFGLNFMGLLKLKFLNREKRWELKFKRLNFFSSILFGVIFGFGWTPCLGAFLGSALALASTSKTILQGITLLLAYSLGLGLPFIISAIIFQKLTGVFNRIKQYSRVINVVSGALLILAGVLIYLDILKYLSI